MRASIWVSRNPSNVSGGAVGFMIDYRICSTVNALKYFTGPANCAVIFCLPDNFLTFWEMFLFTRKQIIFRCFS